MKKWRRWVATYYFLLGALFCSGMVEAQNTEVEQLHKRVAELYGQAKYQEAIVVSEKLLALVENSVGPEHPDFATSLINLAELYRSQGRYAQAEPLFKRALAIFERTLGVEHLNVATSLTNFAVMYSTQGQYAQAEPLFKRALAIREKSLGPAHPEVASSMNELGNIYYTQRQYAQAEPFYMGALGIWEKSLGPDHPYVATVLNNLASIYSSRGQYAQAEQLFKRALTIREKSLGSDHLDVASSMNELAKIYYFQGQYAQADPLFKRALTIQEKSLQVDRLHLANSINDLAVLYSTYGQDAQAEPLFKRALTIFESSLGVDHPNVATGLNNLASMHSSQGQYTQAEQLFKRALTIREKSLGPEHPDFATSLNGLARLYRRQGQYVQAEPLFKRALAILEKSLGPEHPAVAESLSSLAGLYAEQFRNAQAEPLYRRALAIFERSLGGDHTKYADTLDSLAWLYHSQGQYAQAEPLYSRALAIREKSLGADHPIFAASLNSLASLYHSQGQYAQAEPLYKRALAISEKSLGPDHPKVATGLNNLASFYDTQLQYPQAESLFKRALAIREKSLGADHPDVAHVLNQLGNIYYTQGQYVEAEPLYKRALAIQEKSLGPDDPHLANNLRDLAGVYFSLGQYVQALPIVRRASAVYRQRIVSAGFNDSSSREAFMGGGAFYGHLSLLALNPNKEPSTQVTDEALQIVQLAQASGTASAIAKMAARFASGSDAVALLAKRKQDAAERRNMAEAQMVSATSQPPDKRDLAKEQRLREELSRTTKEIEAIDAELTKRFPAYQELTRPAPILVSKIQSLLDNDEAMLIYALGDFAAGDNSYIWVVTREKASFMQLPVKFKDIGAQVSKIRDQMEIDNRGGKAKVSVDILHDLYKNIFAPVLPELAGINHVMVVPSGPLQSLPFGMLVSEAPPQITVDEDYRKVEWLSKRYAFSVLPSVSSIQAFRQFAKLKSASEPFAGFGDPVIGEGGSATRIARSKIDVAGVFRNSVGVRGPAGLENAEVADVDTIRRAPRLPETADELRSMAKILKASSQSIWLQDRATETQVKTMDLSNYRIIAFATHGVMAGELKGIGEAGLILTPPKTGTVEDDGYLAASEIAKLNLNAEWVVLSACNTAAPDGTPGAEGLSGMAKAFFYAGARSLLVSHWPVESVSTVQLTTVMLQEFEANPKVSKAQAQRKAILALMNTPGHPEYAHPLYWAPFVVVGEGGSRVSAN